LQFDPTHKAPIAIGLIEVPTEESSARAITILKGVLKSSAIHILTQMNTSDRFASTIARMSNQWRAPDFHPQRDSFEAK
jgi:hypothetical protein